MKKKLSLLLTLLLCFVVGALADDYALYSGAITEGDYVIYYNGKAMNTTVNSNRLQYAEVTPTEDVIANPDAAIIWTIEKSGDYYTLYNADAGKYAAATGTKNQAGLLDDATDDKALWTVTGTDTYDFVNKANAANSVNATLRNNGTYGFACYAAGTGGALTLYKKVAAGTVAKPAISGTTPFYGSTQVTLTCATAEAAIYYTLDGTEPTDASTPYAEAITLTETTTVKAIAKKGDNVSAVAEKTFTLGTSVATLAAMNDLANNTEFMYTGELLATYVNGDYCYVKDNTGVSLLFKSIPDGVVTGKTINANWTGAVSIYQSLFEVKPDAGQLSAKDGDPVAVTYDKVESVAAADMNKIVVLQGVKAYTAFNKTKGSGDVDARAFTITLKDNSTLVGFNRFLEDTEASVDGKTYDITGAVAVNNETVQFWPITISQNYAVNIASEITGGSVIADPTSATAGTEITLTEARRLP